MSRLIAIAGLLLLFPFVSSSQSIRVCEDDDDNNVFIPISKYMQKGDAECLAAWFADNLQVDVMGSVSNCSRNQARQIIRNFFTNYTPRCFEIVYKSGTYPMKQRRQHVHRNHPRQDQRYRQLHRAAED